MRDDSLERSWIMIELRTSMLIEINKLKEDVYVVSFGKNSSALLDHSEYCNIILRNDMVQYFGEL
jgi:hypothetical protein